MSSRNGAGKSVAPGAAGKAKVADGVADVSLGNGEWETIARKGSKNRGANSKQLAPQTSNANANAWGNNNYDGPQRGAHSGRHAGRGNSRAPQPAIAPPLQNGWKWQSTAASRQLRQSQPEEADEDGDVSDDADDNLDALDDSDDELLSDDYDSDCSEKSHTTLKKSKWFLKFCKDLDKLKIEELNDVERQWHCPACQGGPGAIDWYRGLQPLMNHAKTKGGERMKLHRRLAQLLEEELASKGTSVVPPGVAYDRWKGLGDEEKDREIVWPPMVIIVNTRLDQGENDKWMGMGSPELLDYFKSYNPTRAKHSYGPQGHRGMSLLMFEGSARGYLDAERLHKDFLEEGTDRIAWINKRVLFSPGAKRRLYGYLATKEDMDAFNQHCQGKAKLKYEMKSYLDMVLSQIRQMSEDNQALSWYKDKFAKEKRHSKAVEESLAKVSQKLHQTRQDSEQVILKTKMQHEQHKEEMLVQEQFFNDQIKVIHESREASEENFKRLQQEEREKMKHSSGTTSNVESRKSVEVSQFIVSQDREMEDYAARKEALLDEHDEEIRAMKKQHWEEEVAKEKKLNAALARLKEDYALLQPKDSDLP